MQQHRRVKSTLQQPEHMPQVYRRLWDNVELKEKKAKELSQFVEGNRRVQWLKQMMSTRLLNEVSLKNNKAS